MVTQNIGSSLKSTFGKVGSIGRDALESVKLVGPDEQQKRLKDLEKARMNKLESLNKTDKSGLTPIHYAAGYNKAAIARLLIEQGADPEVEDADGMMPVHHAAKEGHHDVLKVLLDKTLAELGIQKREDILGNYHKVDEAKLEEYLSNQFFKTERNGQRPIDNALKNKRFEAVQLILERCLEYFGRETVYSSAGEI